MPTLFDLVPDVDALVAMAPEELGRALLAAAGSNLQNGMFSPGAVTGDQALYALGPAGRERYPRERRDEIFLATGEGWQWLELNLMIMPAADPNGRNGWKVLTRRGLAIASDEAGFRAYAAAAAFPKALLHPSIADEVWLDLARGDYTTAVFRAFRAVEVAVRDAGGFAPERVGVELMRQAFNPQNGPLAKMGDPAAERDALSALFAGAIGSYKNPHSHRTVVIQEAREAQEMVLLASHLLRIVDARRAP